VTEGTKCINFDVTGGGGGSSLTQEEVDDYVDALINDGDSVHTRITVTYDDANNAMDFVVDDMNDAYPTTNDIDNMIAAHAATADAHHTKTELSIILTDIADGTITSDIVNTDYPWADNEVSDTITVGAAGAVMDGAIPTTMTRDEEWDTIAEIETAISADIITTLDSGVPVTILADGTVSDAEFQYMGGLTSDAQDQIDGKQASGTYYTALTSAIPATQLVDGTVSDTELQYIGGLTSDAQDQIDGKQASGTYYTALTSAIPATQLVDGTVSDTELQYIGGLTSDAQDQIDGKQASGTYYTALTSAIPATQLVDGTVSDVELQYINSLSSNAQDQIDGKQASGTYYTALTSAIPATQIADGTVSDAEFQYIGGLTSDAQDQINNKINTSLVLSDISDGTITSDLVNTDNPWADNEVSDTLTVDNYMEDEDINTRAELESWVSDYPTSLDNSTDVAVVGAERDDVLKFDGSSWVPAAYDYSFVFDFDTFNDDATDTQLLGSGEWEAIGGITFTATYSNGPPTSCWITASGDFNDSGTGWTNDELEMDDGVKTSEATDEATNYPDDSGDAVTFSALADGLTPDAGSYVVTFYNYFIYDNSATGSGWTDGGLDAVATDGTQVITSDHTRTVTQALGASDHLVFAHRKGGTTVTQVRCGTGSDALTTAMDSSDSTAVTPLKETVSHSNAATNAKTEDFYVYTSAEQNIDAHSSSFTTLTSSTVSNYLRAGVDDLNTGWSNADFLALAYQYASTSDETRTSSALTPGVNDYLVYMYPDGWGNLTVGTDYEDDSDTGTSFLFDGVTAAMSYEGANACTNEVGFQDSYRVYVSTGKDYGVGSGTLVGGTVATLNEIYYGVTSTTDSWTETDVEALDDDDGYSPITNDYTQTWTAITLEAGEYGLWCFPKRMGEKDTDYAFKDDDTGLRFDFQAAETISITNISNWSEDFYCYRTTNANLGAITVRTE